jgi:alkanesulfonate monooxygenase SsuD/methylene tetrahydromethanopterin reductase-like flavin-dependent oxidoreductase (luciferase family)
VAGYRQHFRPSSILSAPRVNVTVQVLCADSAAKAQQLAASRNLARLKSTLGRADGIPSLEAALAYPYTVQERAYIEEFSRTFLDGSPQQVREKLTAISALYQTTDIGMVTICHDFADRVRSYELVAEACGLPGQKTAAPETARASTNP